MRAAIGCSSVFAVVVFVIGFAISLFVRDATWIDRLAIGLTPAFIVFVAVLLLVGRDSAKHSASVRSARKYLLSCGSMPENEFLASRPSDHVELLLATRQAISQFFGVPIGQIRRDVNLIHDLHVDLLEPAFQLSVVDSVIISRRIESKPFGFSMAGIETIDELTYAIQKVLVDLKEQTESQENQ